MSVVAHRLLMWRRAFFSFNNPRRSRLEVGRTCTSDSGAPVTVALLVLWNMELGKASPLGSSHRNPKGMCRDS